METHNNQQFSTKDKDNDLSSGNCATTYRGGWWYNNCRIANLNGNYRKGNVNDGIIWHHWKGSSESLEWTEIKIRPKHFRPLSALHATP